MHCPQCGDVMVEEGDIFTCVRGPMSTSIDLARKLREYGETGMNPIVGKAFRIGIGGHWFYT